MIVDLELVKKQQQTSEENSKKWNFPKTAPYDPRFPNTNQSKHCFTYYLDFHRCSKKLGESDEKCKYFKKIYKIMCPTSWVERWDEQVATGTFPATF